MKPRTKPERDVLFLHFRSHTTTSLYELEDFVMNIEVDVCAFDEETAIEHRVGYFEMDRIYWQKAIDRRQSLFDVCDIDSAGMHEMHQILTENSNEIREDFELEAVTEDVLFIHKMILHPDMVNHRAAILNAVIEPQLGMTLATIWQRTCDLTDQELYHLGFKKIAGRPLFARHWTFVNPYAQENLEGLDGHFTGSPEHDEWVAKAIKSYYDWTDEVDD